MKINRENTEQLTHIIRITLEKEDYEGEVEKALKELRKSVSMPGFRPGMVPMGLIRKRFGKQVLSEEVSRMAFDKMRDTILEEKIEIIGEPLAATDQEIPDWEKGSVFTFAFEIAPQPEGELQFPKNVSDIVKHKILSTAENIEKEIESLKESFGKLADVDDIQGEKELLSGTFVYTDANGEEQRLEQVYIPLWQLASDEIRQIFKGHRAGDTLELKPLELYNSEEELRKHWFIAEDQQIPETGKFFIETVRRTQPAELNQELYDSIFGEGVITDDADFREKIGLVLARPVQERANLKLYDQLKKAMIGLNHYPLPEPFMKRWLLLLNRDKQGVTAETIDKEWDLLRDDIIWQIIMNKIATKFDIVVKEEDLMEAASEYVDRQMRSYNLNLDAEEIKKMAQTFLEKEKNRNQVYGWVMDARCYDKILENTELPEKEITMDEYMAMHGEDQSAEA